MRFRVMFTVALALVLLLGVRPTAAQTGLPADALGKAWGLASLQLAPGDTVSTGGKGITLQFAADGSLSGSDGCNTFQGTYKADEDGNLDIALGASTRKACEQAVMDLASTYTQALDAVLGYRLVNDRLDLDGSGGSLLSFAEAPIGPPTTVPATSGEAAPLLALMLLAMLMMGGGALVLRRIPA
jgi:heat shock protein HslJ